MFDFDATITLYDLTNTYFEGSGAGNANAALVTLAFVLDSSDFPKRGDVFTGNASEPSTLSEMLEKLVPSDAAPMPVLPPSRRSNG